MNDESEKHGLDFLIDVVTHDDRVIAHTSRLSAIKNGARNIRAVAAVVVNPIGEWLIPRRSPEATIFPLALDFSAGGYVRSGMTYEQAIHYKLPRELGLDPTTAICQPLRKFSHNETSCFTMLYEIRATHIPNYNRNEFSEVHWMHPLGLFTRLMQGEPHKSDLGIVLSFLLGQPAITVGDVSA